MTTPDQRHYFDGREEEERGEEGEEEEEEAEDERLDGSETEHDGDGEACIDTDVKGSLVHPTKRKHPFGFRHGRASWNEEEINSLLTAMERCSATVAASRKPSLDLKAHAGLSSSSNTNICLPWDVILEHMHTQGYTDKTIKHIQKKVQNLSWSFKNLKTWRLRKQLPLYEDLTPAERVACLLPRRFNPDLYARMDAFFAEMGIKDTAQVVKHHQAQINNTCGKKSNCGIDHDDGRKFLNDEPIKETRNRVTRSGRLVNTDEQAKLDQYPTDLKGSNASANRATKGSISIKQDKATRIEMDVDDNDVEDVADEENDDTDANTDSDDVVNDDGTCHVCFQGQPCTHDNMICELHTKRQKNLGHSKLKDRQSCMAGSHIKGTCSRIRGKGFFSQQSKTNISSKKKRSVGKDERTVIRHNMMRDAKNKIILQHIAATDKQLSDFIEAVKMNIQMVRDLIEKT